MPLLYREKKLKIPHIRLEKKKDSNLWNILFGNSYLGRKSQNVIERFSDVSEEITMDADDVLRFANEIRRILKEKPKKGEKLKLIFRDNKPQLQIVMAYIHPKHNDYYRVKRLGHGQVFGFCPSINIKFKAVPDTREEYQYLYEGEGAREGLLAEYYLQEDLEKFAEELEQEAEKYL